ncbi:MAG: hypothetical protein Q4A84_06445 [Neisseria sp.]|nr:hypothetical protein [Neisseria sp.]MDO4641325.1 hypothetical protein [Neisseria sp.]
MISLHGTLTENRAKAIDYLARRQYASQVVEAYIAQPKKIDGGKSGIKQ